MRHVGCSDSAEGGACDVSPSGAEVDGLGARHHERVAVRSQRSERVEEHSLRLDVSRIDRVRASREARDPDGRESAPGRDPRGASRGDLHRLQGGPARRRRLS
jgi:hypothetical protein